LNSLTCKPCVWGFAAVGNRTAAEPAAAQIAIAVMIVVRTFRKTP